MCPSNANHSVDQQIIVPEVFNPIGHGKFDNFEQECPRSPNSALSNTRWFYQPQGGYIYRANDANETIKAQEEIPYVYSPVNDWKVVNGDSFQVDDQSQLWSWDQLIYLLFMGGLG